MKKVSKSQISEEEVEEILKERHPIAYSNITFCELIPGLSWARKLLCCDRFKEKEPEETNYDT